MKHKCTTQVSDGFGWRWHACSRNAVADPGVDGVPTKCRQHSAEYLAKKKAASDAKLEARMAIYRKAQQLKVLEAQAIAIVRQIAEGPPSSATALCEIWVAEYDRVAES